MDKNILSTDEYGIKAGVEEGVCPLDWLAEHYEEFKGKLVTIDGKLFQQLLDSCDTIATAKFDGHTKPFFLTWKETEKFPQTSILVRSYGTSDVPREGNRSVVKSESNWYVIEWVSAEDILKHGERFATNRKTDKQMLNLVRVPKKIKAKVEEVEV